jgi:hypothetical protein
MILAKVGFLIIWQIGVSEKLVDLMLSNEK